MKQLNNFEVVNRNAPSWNSHQEAGTMLQDKFAALRNPKLGTLLKKASSFLPGSLDAIRGGGSSTRSAGNAGGIATNDLGAGSKYV